MSWKDEFKSRIIAERDWRLMEGGFPTLSGHWFASDLVTRSRISGLSLIVLMAGVGAGPALPDGLTFRSMAGEDVEITTSIVVQMLYGIAKQEAAIWQTAQALLDAMQAAENPEDIPPITGTSWPAIYTAG